MHIKNIFDELDKGSTEVVKSLFNASHPNENKRIFIERICSNGVTSPTSFYYDQDFDEWILILQGRAILQIGANKYNLKKGSYMHIERHVKHRVDYTSKDCIWLTISWQ
ncbi:MAG: cupin domain-containing protein [Bacteroidales bacterium]